MRNKLIIIFCFLVFRAESQNNRATFGLQYKPIIVSSYFNAIEQISETNQFYLEPKYSNSFGMVIRYKINNTFSVEGGINYIQRNFMLGFNNNPDIHFTLSDGSPVYDYADYTKFNLRSYELPIQLLTYVRAAENWYLNIAFGISHNILASGIFSQFEKHPDVFQNTYRRPGGYQALLANIGIEFRDQKTGHYYIGVSLHRPWEPIAKVYPEPSGGLDMFTENEEIIFDVIGNFITLDLRYFFVK